MQQFESHISALFDCRDFLKSKIGSVPHPITKAISDHQKSESGAKRKSGTGIKPVAAVGFERVKNLLETHAPGRYIFNVSISVVEDV